MLDLPENELFSAYIDGELTAEEQAEVEQILNDNPEARQLVDELRSLSSSLQALPSYKLDQDLASRVLRQAEREMLSEPPTALPKFHQVDVLEGAPKSWARRLLRPRNFAWPAAAVAVAVILMLSEPGTKNEREVAKESPEMTFEPLEIVPTVEAAPGRRERTIAKADEDNGTEKGQPAMPEVVAPDPTIVAEKTPDEAPATNKQSTQPKTDSTPLLVLQCQLAEGRIGREALAELLAQAGVEVLEPLADDGGPIELKLTTTQVNKIIAQLQADKGRFSDFALQSTAKTAGPRIPSSFGPDRSHDEETTAAKTGDAKEPPKVTLQVHGTLTIEPGSAARANPSETTSVEGGPSKSKATTKANQVKPSVTISAKDDVAYRVRFLLKPFETPSKSEPSSEK